MGWFDRRPKDSSYRSSDPPGRPLRPGESLWDDPEEDAARRSVPVYSHPEYKDDRGPTPPRYQASSIVPVKIEFPRLKGAALDYCHYIERLESLFAAYFSAARQTPDSGGIACVFYDKLHAFVEALSLDNYNALRILQRLTILENHLKLVESEIAGLEKVNIVSLETRKKHDRIADFLRIEDEELFRLASPLLEARSKRTMLASHVDILIGIWNAADDFLRAVRKEPSIEKLTQDQKIAEQVDCVPEDPAKQTLRYFLFELLNRATKWQTTDGPKDDYWNSDEHRYRIVPWSEHGQLLSRLKAYENSLRNIPPQPAEKRLPSQTIEFLREMRRSMDRGIIPQALIQVALLSEPDDSEYLGVMPDWSEPVPLREEENADSLGRRVVAAVRKLVG